MENITETVMNEATPVIEATVDTAMQAVAQTKAPMSFGKKFGIGTGVVLLIGGGIYVGKKIHAKIKGHKAKAQADEQGYDNVDIAKRDFLDDPAEEPAEEE